MNHPPTTQTACRDRVAAENAARPPRRILPRLWQRLERMRQQRPLLYFVAPVVLCALLILGLSLYPSPPSQLRHGFWNMDKVEHFVAYGLLALLMLRAWGWGRRPRWGWCLLTAIGAGAYGVLLEYLQTVTVDRTASIEDAAANALGAVAGVWLWLKVSKGLAKRRSAMEDVASMGNADSPNCSEGIVSGHNE